MKQKIVYSRATGSIAILIGLFLIVCFFDTSYLVSFYRNHLQGNLGKTHFIVGYSPSPAKDAPAAPLNSPLRRVLFSPDDDVQQELITFIKQEQEGIKVAIFTFTDKEVANALIDAHDRGIRIEVVADASYLRDQYSKIALLEQHKIPIFTYNPHYKNVKQKKQEMLSIMHNKFVIFSKNSGNKSLLWTGSFNFTRSAKLRNQENVLIVDDADTIERYAQQFEQLKKRCTNCKA